METSLESWVPDTESKSPQQCPTPLFTILIHLTDPSIPMQGGLSSDVLQRCKVLEAWMVR